jgi:hypothetical protein
MDYMDYEEVEAAGKEAAYYHTLKDMVDIVTEYGIVNVMSDLFEILDTKNRNKVVTHNANSYMFEDLPF